MKTNTIWFRVDLAKKKREEWYRKMNAKFNGKEYIEKPLSFSFIYKLK